MPRIKIVLTQNGQGVEVDVDDDTITFDELTVKALRLMGGLSDFWDKVEAPHV